LDENIKSEVLKIMESMEGMSIPCISISPMFSIEKKNWRKLLYIFLEIRKNIESQIGSPLIITVCDIFDKKHWKEDIEKLKESKT